MRWRAPWWSWLLVAGGVALFGVLGSWQLQRGLDKQAWIAKLRNSEGPREPLTGTSPAPAATELVRADATGHFDSRRQLLQDGQSRGGRPGFHVWTPLRLTAGGVLLVNRGWIPQPERLADLPDPAAPSGAIEVRGWWRSLPEPGIRVGDPGCAPAQRFPVVVVYPAAGQLDCLFGEAVVPGLLLLDADRPGGFVREWSHPGLPPERHFGYAVTWYALGLTALFLFIKLNRKP